MARIDGRANDELRPTTITPGFQEFAEGSVLVEVGKTRVVCSASVEERVPAFLRGQAQGWITAESGMLPRATLSRTPPTAAVHDSLIYDPDNPVGTCGGQIFWNMEGGGPQDQRHLLERDDMLYYQSEVLAEPVCVIGNVSVDLTIATDVDDTDMIVRLCVVAASGAITCILVGSFRCRYREGFDKRVPLVHGEPTALHFRLSQVAYTFPIGSRVALMVTPPRINPVSMSRGQLVDINQARLGTAPRIGMLPWAPTATGPF